MQPGYPGPDPDPYGRGRSGTESNERATGEWPAGADPRRAGWPPYDGRDPAATTSSQSQRATGGYEPPAYDRSAYRQAAYDEPGYGSSQPGYGSQPGYDAQAGYGARSGQQPPGYESQGSGRPPGPAQPGYGSATGDQYGGYPDTDPAYGAAGAGYRGGRPTPYQPPRPPQNNTLGLTAMILGIASIPLLCASAAGTVFAVIDSLVPLAAVVLGWLGMRRAAQGRAANRGQALAGVVSGTIALVVAILAFVVVPGNPFG